MNEVLLRPIKYRHWKQNFCMIKDYNGRWLLKKRHWNTKNIKVISNSIEPAILFAEEQGNKIITPLAKKRTLVSYQHWQKYEIGSTAGAAVQILCCKIDYSRWENSCNWSMIRCKLNRARNKSRCKLQVNIEEKPIELYFDGRKDDTPKVEKKNCVNTIKTISLLVLNKEL